MENVNWLKTHKRTLELEMARNGKHKRTLALEMGKI